MSAAGDRLAAGSGPVPARHQPVMTAEVLAALAPHPGGRYLDATLGLAGHAAAVLRAAGPSAELVGIERDAQALGLATGVLDEVAGRVRLIEGRFEERLPELAAAGERFDGVLFDLGVSSLQIDSPERGFSLRRDGPLDMRMAPGQGPTAADLLAAASEAEIESILRLRGEERWAARIARRLVEGRDRSPIETTGRLARIVEDAIPRRAWPPRLHPATRTFQALRIAVNDELDGLEAALAAAFAMLVPGGRLAVLAFHSLEDRIVKRFLAELFRRCTCARERPVCVCGGTARARRVGTQPQRPGAEELAANPRARSVRLRAAEKRGQP